MKYSSAEHDSRLRVAHGYEPVDQADGWFTRHYIAVCVASYGFALVGAYIGINR